MHYTSELTTVAVVLLLACISPGPDFVAVTSQSLASRRAGIRTAAGIALAITAWAALTLCGLSLLLAKIDGLYAIVRLAGAAYLIYLGVHLLLGARRPVEPAERPVADPRGGSFSRGFVIGITNPKSAAFFSSLFATVLPATAPLWVDASTVAIAATVAGLWFSLLALMFSARRIQSIYAAARRWIDATMGLVLTALGVRLAWSR